MTNTQDHTTASEAAERFLSVAAPAFARLLRELRPLSARRMIDAVAFILSLFMQQVLLELQRRAQANAALHLATLIGFLANRVATSFNEHAAGITHLPALMPTMPDRIAGSSKAEAINRLRVFMVASAHHHRHLMTPSCATMPAGISHSDAQAVDGLDLVAAALLHHAEMMVRYVGLATARSAANQDILIASAGEDPSVKATLITLDQAEAAPWDDPPNPALCAAKASPLPVMPIHLGINPPPPNGHLKD